MIKVAITGGIGSGKSVVARLLELMGVPVYFTDDEAKRLNVTDPSIRKGLCALVGEEVYRADGSLNKALLAEYLFADADHLAQINALIHPVVKHDFVSWVARQHEKRHPVVAMECAILYEAGFDQLVDVVVVVSAPLEVRVKRAMARDGASEAQVRKRIAHQLADEAVQARAAYTIVNDGCTPLIPQVIGLLHQISEA